MVNLTTSGQYFSLETVISGTYAKFPTRMMLSPNFTLDVRMNFRLPEWSLDYINMCNITCQVLWLSTLVFTKCSEKNIQEYICGEELKRF